MLLCTCILLFLSSNKTLQFKSLGNYQKSVQFFLLNLNLSLINVIQNIIQISMIETF